MITEEQQKDFEARAQAFEEDYAKAYEELKAKHECEMVYGVVTVPSPAGIFGLGVQQSVGDLKYKSVPSPKEFVSNAEAS